MPTLATIREEEREARAQHRHIERMHRAKRHKGERAWRERLREALTELPRGLCRCELRSVHSPEELRALGGGCTMPSHCCPRLDALRRRMGA